MIYEIVFKLNLGPNGPLTRNPNNLIAVERSGMSPSGVRSLKICSLNARSLRNKSAAFVELVHDLKADLCTICETWLSVNDSVVLNELTPTGYNTLYHCPRSGRRGEGTALLVRNEYVTSKISCIEKSSFEVSEWLVDVRSTRLRILIIYRPPPSSSFN